MVKKILLVATGYAPGMIPFAATIINSLANCKDFDVHAVTVNSGKKTYKNVLKNRNRVTFIEYPHSKIKKLIYKFYPFEIINKIEELDHQHHFDVIHLLTGDFSLALYLKLKGRDKRWFYTVHDLHPHPIGRKPFLWTLLRKYMLFCNGVNRATIFNLTTSSWSQYRELVEMYPQKQISFTHFPTLMTNAIKNGVENIPELENESRYILFMGSVEHYKGVDLLIKAFEQSFLSKETKLVIAGKGEIYGDKKNVIRINRFIKDEEIKELYSKAELVVYPYRIATMSGVLSIAFYFKKKVLLSDIPFFLDNRTLDCFYFENGNIDSLQDKLEEAFKATSDNTIDGYNEIYSNATLTKDYLNLYKYE